MSGNGADDHARLHLIVSGRVQGVFFRHSTMQQAQKLDLTGWVRNLGSGEVEIVAEGKWESLQILSAWAHVGPPVARVDVVAEEWPEFRGEFSEFQIR